MSRALPFLLLLLALPLGRAAGADTGFAGVVEMADTISGLQSDGVDREEFDRYAKTVDERLQRARGDLGTAPPVVAQALREDIGFYQAELERIAASTGKELVLSTFTYRISRGRVALTAPPLVYRIDRNRGIAQCLLPDNTVTEVELVSMPEVDASGGENGPPMLGLRTKRYERTIAGKQYTLTMAPDLPNVCAMGAIAGATGELFAGIARLPGMPLLIETRDGGLVRRLVVTRITPRELPDQEFAPWK